MERHHRDILLKNHQALVKNISDIDSVVSELYSKCVLTEYMFKKMCQSEEMEKVKELLLILPRSGEKAFNQFYSVLVSEDIDEGDAADLLKPELKEQRKEARRQKVAFCPFDQEVESDEDALPEVWPEGDPSGVELKTCKKNHTSMYKKFKFVLENPLNDTIYPMTKQRRGICMIINNDVFSNNILPEREGSANDSRLLVDTFEKLNFEVDYKENITSEEIKNIVKRFSEMNHSEYECFVMVIMSHGRRGHVYGADGKLVGISEITDSFKTCTSLNKKPKLFFVQACQNDEVQAISDELQKLSNDQCDASGDPNILTDYFVAMSTTPDNISWRNSIFGSWFIQAMIYVLCKFAYRTDIADIMTKITRIVVDENNPNYSEIFSYKVNEIEIIDNNLVVQVWDYDVTTQDDFLGEVIIRLQDFNFKTCPVHTAWYTLNANTDLSVSGELEISLDYQVPQQLYVTVHHATCLSPPEGQSSANPFVKIAIPGSKTSYMSQVIRNFLEPKWNETFEFIVPREEFAFRYIVFHVVDENDTYGNSSLGQVLVDLDTFDPERGLRESYKLADLRNSKHMRNKVSQSFTSQEFRESFMAHASIRHPQFLFDKDTQSGKKILTLTCRKAKCKGRVRVVDGVLVA